MPRGKSFGDARLECLKNNFSKILPSYLSKQHK